MTSVIVGVDPGLTKGSAVAVLDRDDGRLLAARLVMAGKHWMSQPAALAEIVGWDNAAVRSTGWTLDRLVAELPQVYQAGQQKGAQADLVNLAALAGAWCWSAITRGGEAELVLPATWKGQVPKAVMERRLRAEMSPEEIAIVERAAPPSRRNDVWDAVGIARWGWRKAR